MYSCSQVRVMIKQAQDQLWRIQYNPLQVGSNCMTELNTT